ncbi:MAG: hypothetical protein ACRD22_21650, partial [Terriglobia bacterium]
MAILVACLTLQAATPSLPSGIVDVQYSTATDPSSPTFGKIVMVSSDKNLYVCDPETGACQPPVSLSQVPLGVSISPDGTHVAVMESGSVDYVDLQSQAVQPIPMWITSGSIVLTATDIYIFPSSGSGPIAAYLQFGPPYGFAPTTGFEQGNSSARLDPNTTANAIYGIRNDVVPSSLFEAQLSPYGFSTLPTYGASSSTYRVCGNIWFSPDGNSI